MLSENEKQGIFEFFFFSGILAIAAVVWFGLWFVTIAIFSAIGAHGFEFEIGLSYLALIGFFFAQVRYNFLKL